MKQLTIKTWILVFLLTSTIRADMTIFFQPSCDVGNTATLSCAVEAPHGCTVFTVVKDGRVFLGGNDDYITLDSIYWVEPGAGKDYGVVWTGDPLNVQQGVNEKGLAYDANGLPRVDTNPHNERTSVYGDYNVYPLRIMRECATVEEVIEWVESHEWHTFMHDQMQFADASGDAVIISAGADGELVYTRKPPGDGYLVSTNFNVANPSNAYGYPCWRYETARELLGGLVDREGTLTAQDAADVLDAVHVEEGTSWTRNSLVADLSNGVIYLYYFHQFDQPVVLNVADELATGREPGPLSALFPEDVQKEAARRYERIQRAVKLGQGLGVSWLVAVLTSLAILVGITFKERQGWRLWLPVVIAFGPLGLLAWLVLGRRPQQGAGRTALVEALGDVAPTIFAYTAFLSIAVLMPAVMGSETLQLLLILGLPLLVGLLFFQGPLLAHLSGKSYLSTLRERLPLVVVVANLGVAGVNTVAIQLVNLSLNYLSIMTAPGYAILVWWLGAALSGFVGVLLCMLYEIWAVKRGFQAWSVLAWDEGELHSPSWRALWWWILLSYAALVCGLVVSAVLQGLLS